MLGVLVPCDRCGLEPEGWSVVAYNIREWRKGMGFRTPSHLDDSAARDLMLGKLMLIVTEICEAYEAPNRDDQCMELGDTCIRILDILATTGGNPAELIEAGEPLLGLRQRGFDVNCLRMMCRVSAAAESVRDADLEETQSHLADVFVSIERLVSLVDYDLGGEIEEKMAINQNREHRHGRQTTL